eukprot:CAMPEP_0180411406 /NCGR_PEP_ID=MMETSP0989-20121125/43957_1 /TAXON_ID=697907 /ORGANISM="non described non described, Strain CCMP2293" /LENGTH=250 /DNA_ID=CAMNT_0022415737 /DNA_START=97 /DNA_END=846 /DNA_ORIENTATION=-
MGGVRWGELACCLLLVFSVNAQSSPNPPVQQRQGALGDSIASLSPADATSSLSLSRAGSALRQVPVDRELPGVRREGPSQSQASPQERGIEAEEPQQISAATEPADSSLPIREAADETSDGDQAEDWSTDDEQGPIPFSASGAERGGGRDAPSVSAGGAAPSGNAWAASPASASTAMLPGLDGAASPGMSPEMDGLDPAPERQGARQTEVPHMEPLVPREQSRPAPPAPVTPQRSNQALSAPPPAPGAVP